MYDVIIEVAAQVITCLMVTLIGVLGAWLTKKIGDNKNLENIALAQAELIKMAQQTVEELQQTFVDGAKAAAEDGKLTKEEIEELGERLVDGTLKKMSSPSIKLLEAAAVDVEALIKSSAEAWIHVIK